MDEHQRMVELYKTIFETWRFQINSYWQRSSYFAAFETAAIFGCWHLIVGTPPHLKAGALVSILGAVLTIIWLINNHKTHKYVDYWWIALGKIEGKLALPLSTVDGKQQEQSDFAFVGRHTGSGQPPYTWVVQSVPVLFFVVWLALLCKIVCVGTY